MDERTKEKTTFRYFYRRTQAEFIMKFLNVQTHFIAFWFPDGCASRTPEHHKNATFFSLLQSEAAVTEGYRKV